MRKSSLFALTIILVLLLFPLVSAQLNTSEDLTNGLNNVNEKINLIGDLFSSTDNNPSIIIPDTYNLITKYTLGIENEVKVYTLIISIIIFFSLLFIIVETLYKADIDFLEKPAKIIIAIVVTLIIGATGIIKYIAESFITFTNIFEILGKFSPLGLFVFLAITAIVIISIITVLKYIEKIRKDAEAEETARSVYRFMKTAKMAGSGSNP